MDLNEGIQEMNNNKKLRFSKSRSSNNFGSTFTFFPHNNLVREAITSRPRAQSSIKYSLMKSKSQKKNMVLSGMDTPLFLGQIKNKKVRNFYETILKSCCKEKEPKERHLKNIFRINKNKNQRNSFVLNRNSNPRSLKNFINFANFSFGTMG